MPGNGPAGARKRLAPTLVVLSRAANAVDTDTTAVDPVVFQFKPSVRHVTRPLNMVNMRAMFGDDDDASSANGKKAKKNKDDDRIVDADDDDEGPTDLQKQLAFGNAFPNDDKVSSYAGTIIKCSAFGMWKVDDAPIAINGLTCDLNIGNIVYMHTHKNSDEPLEIVANTRLDVALAFARAWNKLHGRTAKITIPPSVADRNDSGRTDDNPDAQEQLKMTMKQMCLFLIIDGYKISEFVVAGCDFGHTQDDDNTSESNYGLPFDQDMLDAMAKAKREQMAYASIMNEIQVQLKRNREIRTDLVREVSDMRKFDEHDETDDDSTEGSIDGDDDAGDASGDDKQTNAARAPTVVPRETQLLELLKQLHPVVGTDVVSAPQRKAHKYSADFVRDIIDRDFEALVTPSHENDTRARRYLTLAVPARTNGFKHQEFDEWTVADKAKFDASACNGIVLLLSNIESSMPSHKLMLQAIEHGKGSLTNVTRLDVMISGHFDTASHVVHVTDAVLAHVSRLPGLRDDVKFTVNFVSVAAATVVAAMHMIRAGVRTMPVLLQMPELMSLAANHHVLAQLARMPPRAQLPDVTGQASHVCEVDTELLMTMRSDEGIVFVTDTQPTSITHTFGPTEPTWGVTLIGTGDTELSFMAPPRTALYFMRIMTNVADLFELRVAPPGGESSKWTPAHLSVLVDGLGSDTSYGSRLGRLNVCGGADVPLDATQLLRLIEAFDVMPPLALWCRDCARSSDTFSFGEMMALYSSGIRQLKAGRANGTGPPAAFGPTQMLDLMLATRNMRKVTFTKYMYRQATWPSHKVAETLKKAEDHILRCLDLAVENSVPQIEADNLVNIRVGWCKYLDHVNRVMRDCGKLLKAFANCCEMPVVRDIANTIKAFKSKLLTVNDIKAAKREALLTKKDLESATPGQLASENLGNIAHWAQKTANFVLGDASGPNAGSAAAAPQKSHVERAWVPLALRAAAYRLRVDCAAMLKFVRKIRNALIIQNGVTDLLKLVDAFISLFRAAVAQPSAQAYMDACVWFRSFGQCIRLDDGNATLRELGLYHRTTVALPMYESPNNRLSWPAGSMTLSHVIGSDGDTRAQMSVDDLGPVLDDIATTLGSGRVDALVQAEALREMHAALGNMVHNSIDRNDVMLPHTLGRLVVMAVELIKANDTLIEPPQPSNDAHSDFETRMELLLQGTPSQAPKVKLFGALLKRMRMAYHVAVSEDQPNVELDVKNFMQCAWTFLHRVHQARVGNTELRDRLPTLADLVVKALSITSPCSNRERYLPTYTAVKQTFTINSFRDMWDVCIELSDAAFATNMARVLDGILQTSATVNITVPPAPTALLPKEIKKNTATAAYIVAGMLFRHYVDDLVDYTLMADTVPSVGEAETRIAVAFDFFARAKLSSTLFEAMTRAFAQAESNVFFLRTCAASSAIRRGDFAALHAAARSMLAIGKPGVTDFVAAMDKFNDARAEVEASLDGAKPFTYEVTQIDEETQKEHVVSRTIVDAVFALHGIDNIVERLVRLFSIFCRFIVISDSARKNFLDGAKQFYEGEWPSVNHEDTVKDHTDNWNYALTTPVSKDAKKIIFAKMQESMEATRGTIEEWAKACRSVGQKMLGSSVKDMTNDQAYATYRKARDSVLEQQKLKLWDGFVNAQDLQEAIDGLSNRDSLETPDDIAGALGTTTAAEWRMSYRASKNAPGAPCILDEYAFDSSVVPINKQFASLGLGDIVFMTTSAFDVARPSKYTNAMDAMFDYAQRIMTSTAHMLKQRSSNIEEIDLLRTMLPGIDRTNASVDVNKVLTSVVHARAVVPNLTKVPVEPIEHCWQSIVDRVENGLMADALTADVPTDGVAQKIEKKDVPEYRFIKRALVAPGIAWPCARRAVYEFIVGTDTLPEMCMTLGMEARDGEMDPTADPELQNYCQLVSVLDDSVDVAAPSDRAPTTPTRNSALRRHAASDAGDGRMAPSSSQPASLHASSKLSRSSTLSRHSPPLPPRPSKRTFIEVADVDSYRSSQDDDYGGTGAISSTTSGTGAAATDSVPSAETDSSAAGRRRRPAAAAAAAVIADAFAEKPRAPSVRHQSIDRAAMLDVAADDAPFIPNGSALGADVELVDDDDGGFDPQSSWRSVSWSQDNGRARETSHVSPSQSSGSRKVPLAFAARQKQAASMHQSTQSSSSRTSSSSSSSRSSTGTASSTSSSDVVPIKIEVPRRAPRPVPPVDAVSILSSSVASSSAHGAPSSTASSHTSSVSGSSSASATSDSSSDKSSDVTSQSSSAAVPPSAQRPWQPAHSASSQRKIVAVAAAADSPPLHVLAASPSAASASVSDSMSDDRPDAVSDAPSHSLPPSDLVEAQRGFILW